jgi:hypothetical protein
MIEFLKTARISQEKLDELDIYMNTDGDAVFCCEAQQFLTTITKEEWIELRSFIDSIFDLGNEEQA